MEVEPAAGAENEMPGNDFDTEATVTEVLSHNEVHDRLCPEENVND